MENILYLNYLINSQQIKRLLDNKNMKRIKHSCNDTKESIFEKIDSCVDEKTLVVVIQNTDKFTLDTNEENDIRKIVFDYCKNKGLDLLVMNDKEYKSLDSLFFD